MTDARRAFHLALLEQVLLLDGRGVPSNADKDSKISVAIAQGIYAQLRAEPGPTRVRLAAQTSGAAFETACASFVETAFDQLQGVRPGDWHVEKVGGRNGLVLAGYAQYQHLISLAQAARESRELAVALGNAYAITPDIVVWRTGLEDQELNRSSRVVDDASGLHSPLRLKNGQAPVLHASISCKWTMRSDRAQNARSEALNLIRNRKGRVPHIAVITAEPLPSRIASLALGTGDIDCVYHFALLELQQALDESPYEDASEMLNVLIEGQRLRDISDLPLDLAL